MMGQTNRVIFNKASSVIRVIRNKFDDSASEGDCVGNCFGVSFNSHAGERVLNRCCTHFPSGPHSILSSGYWQALSLFCVEDSLKRAFEGTWEEM
jgi:hypothetical protein